MDHVARFHVTPKPNSYIVFEKYPRQSGRWKKRTIEKTQKAALARVFHICCECWHKMKTNNQRQKFTWPTSPATFLSQSLRSLPPPPPPPPPHGATNHSPFHFSIVIASLTFDLPPPPTPSRSGGTRRLSRSVGLHYSLSMICA